MKQKGIFALLANLAITIFGIILIVYSMETIARSKAAPGFEFIILAGLILTPVGCYATFYELQRFIVLLRMDSNDDVHARWTYEPAVWEIMRNKALSGLKAENDLFMNKPAQPFCIKFVGYTLGANMLISSLLSDNLTLIVLAWVAITGGAYAGLILLTKPIRKRAIQNDSGEVVIARGGVWFMGQLIQFSEKNLWLELAEVLEKENGLVLVLYTNVFQRTRDGLGYTTKTIYHIPIPEGREQEAKEAAELLKQYTY